MEFFMAVLAGFVLGVLSMVALAVALVVRKRREAARGQAGRNGVGAVRNVKIRLGESAVAVLNSDDPARRSIVHNL